MTKKRLKNIKPNEKAYQLIKEEGYYGLKYLYTIKDKWHIFSVEVYPPDPEDPDLVYDIGLPIFLVQVGDEVYTCQHIEPILYDPDREITSEDIEALRKIKEEENEEDI